MERPADLAEINIRKGGLSAIEIEWSFTRPAPTGNHCHRWPTVV
jgi:hypothetical protein